MAGATRRRHRRRIGCSGCGRSVPEDLMAGHALCPRCRAEKYAGVERRARRKYGRGGKYGF